MTQESKKGILGIFFKMEKKFGVVFLGSFQQDDYKALEKQFILHFVEPVSEPTSKNVKVLVFRSPYNINKSVISKYQNLALVIRAGSGIEGVDFDLLNDREISFRMCSADGSSVAELAVGMLIALYRNFSLLSSGKWDKHLFIGNTLKGKQVGIIGFGKVGQSIAGLVKAFGMVVSIYDRTPHRPWKKDVASSVGGVFENRLKDLIAKSEVLFVACPLNSETLELIGEKELDYLPKNAVIVNVARSGIFDIDSLCRKVETGEVYGICSDVFDKSTVERLKSIPNSRIIATPHIGAQTMETMKDISTSVNSEIVGFLERSNGC